ncbi:hypothetical protein J3E64_001347 [Sphingobium sp. OAS761]|uniref:hypothetical protein n=1 Tax=Sphingobium sp. OAS761 TaxID=2817901 RepID=UPI00209FD7AE|nr:hypothetical protein [Sphingobium sp. OAS761]MCP1469665.1 hypothetical protein [Sphingobium sp. OAS761]
MIKFNRLTLVAAAEVVADFKSHSDMAVLEVQWGIDGRCDASSKPARVASLAKIAIDEEIDAITEHGLVPLGRALIETAIEAPPKTKASPEWTRLIAGLRFDGFELVEDQTDGEADFPWRSGRTRSSLKLVRMLPTAIPELDFREAESEVVMLMDRHGLTVTKGHLKHALSAFGRGEWASANGALRNFYESYLNEIADRLGYIGPQDSKARRDFLGQLNPPFLLSDYNEWNINNQKPQYIQGLMSRMHPHGGHPGLSEEEDATFRLQINLVTARLLLRRFDQRSP